MKFLHYAALLATTSAIRIQQASAEPTLFEAIELDKKIPSPEEIWKKFDKDGSNSWDLKETMAAFKATMKYFKHKLPKDWKKMVKAEFKNIDIDNSGAIDPKEMMTYMFKMVDENDDGAWDLKEVLDAIKGLARFSKNKLIKGWKKMVTDVFDHVDKNGDGKASPKELMAALKEHGVPDINDLFEKKGQKALKMS
jgi:Ca2+-binding EF-hand superfamily protein